MVQKTYTVKAKNKDFNGVRCGVRFEDGVAKKVPQAAAVQLVARGYDCDAVEKIVTEATEAAHQAAAEKSVAKAKGVATAPSAGGETSPSSPNLEAIVGIGPVTAKKLTDAGTATPLDLIIADHSVVAETADASVEEVQGWVEQAVALLKEQN